MATRLLVAIAVVVLAGCSGPRATVPPDPIPSLAAPFQAHLNEYLDEAWLSPPNEAIVGCLAELGGSHRACGLEGSINGSVVIVEADTRQIAPEFLEALAHPDRVHALVRLKRDGGTPISLATTPAEVGTVALRRRSHLLVTADAFAVTCAVAAIVLCPWSGP